MNFNLFKEKKKTHVKKTRCIHNQQGLFRPQHDSLPLQVSGFRLSEWLTLKRQLSPENK